MAKTIGRLTAPQVNSAALAPGLHSDGGNLYLRVGKSGARSWALLYRFDGKQREAGLGKAGKGGVSLADARRKAREGRDLLDQRPPIDPLSVWRAPTAVESSVKTFAEAAVGYIALNEPGWKGGKSAQQWRNTIKTYCKPLLDRPVDQITAVEVRRVLEPIWTRVPETASRLRGRIEAVIDYAKPDDETRPNPARWRGGLKGKLPTPKDLGKVNRSTGKRAERGHHGAMSYKDIPTFARRLRTEDGVEARALEFTLVTASRTGEVLGAKWSEVDLHAATWSVPPERLKVGKKLRKPHVVPLSPRALAILAEMSDIRSSDYVFPGRLTNQPLSDTALLALLQRRMGFDSVTVHGFRSTFRDYAGDVTSFPREVCEQALGHTVGGVEGAYRRGDALEKRRKLMNAWAAFCESTPEGATGNILPFESKSARTV